MTVIEQTLQLELQLLYIHTYMPHPAHKHSVACCIEACGRVGESGSGFWVFRIGRGKVQENVIVHIQNAYSVIAHQVQSSLVQVTPYS